MRMIRCLALGWLLLFATDCLQACGFSVWNEAYRYHLMFPEALGKGPIMPYHFTSSYLYSNPSEYDELGKQKNSKEWSEMDMGRHSPEQWDYALYAYDYSDIINDRDPLMHSILHGKDKELVEVYKYIKTVEAAFEITSLWTNDGEQIPAQMKLLYEEGIALYSKSKKKQSKCRIAYQLLRLCELNKYEEVFANCLLPVKKYSVVGDWADFRYAGYLDRIGKKAEANIYYARLFTSCDEMKYSCYGQFNRKEINQSLKLVKSQSDKEALLALSILRQPTMALDHIKNLYAINPNHPLIDMLVLREINKMEDLIYSPKLTEMSIPSVFPWWYEFDDLPDHFANKLYEKQLRAFVWKQTLNKKKNNAFWNLASAYLCLLNNSPVKAAEFLAIAKTQKNFTPEMAIQAKTMELLLMCSEIGSNAKKRREEIASSFLTLEAQLQFVPYGASILSNLALVMGYRNHQVKEYEMAAICYSYAAHYNPNRFNEYYWHDYHEYNNPSEKKAFVSDDDANYEGAMQSFFYLEREVKTARIENLLSIVEAKNNSSAMNNMLRRVTTNKFRLYDLIGQRHFVAGQYKKSLHAFNKIPDIWWDTCIWEVYKYLPTNPFHSPLIHIRSPLSEMPAPLHSNKCIILDSLCRWDIEQKKLNGEARAEAQFKMASLLLNCTYIGNAWAMSRYWHYGDDQNSGEYGYTYQKGVEAKLDADYFGQKSAHRYFLKAYASSKDPDLRSSSLAHAAYCEDPFPSFIYGKSSRNRLKKMAPSLSKLLAEYPDLASGIYSSCLGFDDFLAK